MRNFYQTLGILLFSLTFMLLQTDLMGQATINVPGDHATIQAAIDAADPGDIIVVGSGTYEETIDINAESLTVQSVDGSASTTIKGTGSAASAATVRITADNVTLEGFTIDNENAQGGCVSGGNDAENAAIKNNVFTNSARGVRGDFYGNFGSGLSIQNNVFDGVTRGVTNSEGWVSVTVTDNEFNNIGANAVSFGSGITTVTFADNSFSNVAGRHVANYEAASNFDLNNALSQNTFDRAAGCNDVSSSIQQAIYSTITQAIDEAAQDATIEVTEGTYDEALTITTNGISLIGLEGGANMEKSGNRGGVGISLSANGVHFENLQVSNRNSGLRLTGDVDGLTIDDCQFTNCGTAFWAEQEYSHQNITIENSGFDNNTFGWQIINTNSGNPNVFDHITVTNTTFNNNTRKGLYIERLRNATFDGIVVDNSGTDADWGFPNGLDINLKWDEYSDITISNSQFTNSGVMGTNTDPENPASVTIKARDDGSSYGAMPASLDNVTFANNFVSGPENGLRFGEFGTTNETPTNVTVENNHFGNAYNNKALIHNVDAPLVASCNWFGTTDGSEIEDLISGNLIVSPALDSGDDSGSADPGFSPEGDCNVCVNGVVTNTTQNTTYCFIQEAIDAADDGDVIEVGPGTYNEALEILTDNLTLVSADGAATTIINAGGATNAIQIGEYSYPGIHPTGVTIDGFTVDGWAERGIGQRNGTGTVYIRDNTLEGPVSGARNGINISGGTNSEITGNNITTSSFNQEDWSGTGILLMGSENALVENNSVLGADLGIVIAGYPDWNNNDPSWVSASGNSIKGNTVNNCVSGIALAGEVSNNTIEENTIESNERGVNEYPQLGGTPSGNVVDNNTIEDNEWGIRISSSLNGEPDYDPAMTITNNSFTNNLPFQVRDFSAKLDVENVVVNNTFDRGVYLEGGSAHVGSVIQSFLSNDNVTVNVLPGTYVEQLTIENSLSLEAESGAVLQAPDAGDRNTVSIPENSRTFDPIIFVDGDDEVIEVSISGFEIDGNEDPGSDSYMGVLARVADITIEGNSFHRMIGSQETVTIGLYNCNEILVHDNHITDFSRNAMTIVDATSNNVVVSENVIVGRGYVGTGFWAQNGIQLSGDFESEITQNHLSDIGWEWPGSGTRWSSTGILLFDSGESLVADNTLHNVQTGIHCNNGSFTADKNIYNMDDAGDLFDVIGIRANPEGRDVMAWPFDFEGNGSAGNNASRSADFIWVITNNNIDGDIDASGFIVGLGIWPDDDGNSVEVTVENNIITNWSGAAIDIWNDDDFTASVINNFLANNNMAIENFTGTTISATCNWYGTTDAGVIAASISGEVDFFPWLTDGTDAEPGETGFTPVTGACDVEIFVQLDDSQNPNCPGGSDGSIDVTVSDGQAPYTFSWTGPDGFSSTVQNISGLSEGVYNLTVTDAADPANTAVFSSELSDPEDEVEVTQVADMGPLCAGDQLEVSFDASGLGSSHTFEWTNDNTEVGPADGSGDIDFGLTNATTEAQTGTFSVVATSDLGCESDPMTFEVTVGCATISGTIEELDGTAMEGVTVNMSGDDTQSTTTNSAGEYTFDQAVGTSFVIEPDFGQNFTGPGDLGDFGVTSADATAILNHINGSQILTGKPLISADTRTTNNVTGADRAAIIVGLLGNPIAINFWNTQSWYFIEDGHVFNNPAIPWDYASSIEVGGANGDIENVNFQGIRKGDITGAVAAVDDFYSGPSRSGNVVNMVMKEKDLQPGQTVEVDVRFSDFESVTSMQLAVEFDQTALELAEVITGDVLSDFDGQNVGLYALDQGIIRFVWATSSDNAQTLGTDDVVFTLVFESNAAEGSKLSEALGISESDISPLVFTDLAEMPIEAVFEEALSTGDLFGDGSQFAAVAQPNPFADRTSIQLNMPLAGQLEIEIYTADGRLVNSFTRDLPAGEAEVILDGQKIDRSGLYFIHLRSETGTSILRLVKTGR